MQPLRLELHNFGPYDHCTIDFRSFYAQSLFLITGKTGAGKTTIFDGMTYALYGSTSGGLRQGKDMRSSFATPDERTVVTFEFSYRDLTYTVTREPEQLVNKARGTGTRVQPAKVCLTVYNQEGQEIKQLTKEKEVGLFIHELLQLNRAQFLQIIMLPQGEFRRFLNADSNDKEKVLRQLFNTSLYQQIAEQLKEQKKKRDRQLAEVRQETLILAKQLQFDDSLREKLIADSLVTDYLEVYEEQTIRYDSQIKELKTHLRQQTETYNQLLEKITQGERINQRFAQLKDVKQSLSELDNEKDQIVDLKVRANRLNQVATLDNTYTLVLEKQQDITELTNKLIAINREITNLDQQLVTCDQEIQSLQKQDSEMAQKQDRVVQIDLWLPLVTEQQVIKEQLRVKEKELTDQKELLQQLTGDVTSLQKKKSELDLIVSQEVTFLKQLNTCEQDMKTNDWLCDRIEELKKLLVQTQKLEEQKKYDLIEKDQVIERLNSLEQAKRVAKSDLAKQLIQQLMSDLLPGEPCPVCGSLEHPKSDAQHMVTDTTATVHTLTNELDQLDVELESVRLVYQTLTGQLTGYQQQLDQLALTIDTKKASIQADLPKSISPNSPVSEWKESLEVCTTAIKKQIKQLQKQLIVIDQAKEDSIRCQDELDILSKRQATIQLVLSDCQQVLASHQGVLESISQKLPSHNLQGDSLQEEKLQLMQIISTWQNDLEKQQHELVETQQALQIKQVTKVNYDNQLDELEKRTAQLSTQLMSHLADNQLSFDEFLALRPKLPELEAIIEKVQQFEKEEYALKRELQLLTKELANQMPVELEEWQVMCDNLKVELDVSKQELAEQRFIMDANEQVMNRIQALLTKAAKDLEQLQELTELSDVLNGDGMNKLSLERYVLQLYLAEILRLANQRLALLTTGRYRFEINHEQGSYKKSTGLEMNIFDDFTGVSRSVNTLSGGESFIAALSLSLALTEVIQQNAGGIMIDAMFIDEGFGSLDEESLEMAIRSLELIRGDGRLIGIISHVRELKERIPQQLQVIASPEGKSRIKERLEFE